MLNELPALTNEPLVGRMAAQFSEVAHGGKLNFEQQKNERMGGVLGAFYDNYCLAIRHRDGAAVTVERNGIEKKSILFSLGWNSATDRKACFYKTAHWDKTV